MNKGERSISAVGGRKQSDRYDSSYDGKQHEGQMEGNHLRWTDVGIVFIDTAVFVGHEFAFVDSLDCLVYST